jgi:2,3-bisphosphoglycerate-independent phosphoglycerate mutase
MKYVVLLGDGMADWDIESLGGKTPLAYAKTPHMDRIAREGTLGLIDTVPRGLKPGSDVAIHSVLATTRGLLHGRARWRRPAGRRLDPGDWPSVHPRHPGDGADPVMADFTAGHITSARPRRSSSPHRRWVLRP